MKLRLIGVLLIGAALGACIQIGFDRYVTFGDMTDFKVRGYEFRYQAPATIGKIPVAVYIAPANVTGNSLPPIPEAAPATPAPAPKAEAPNAAPATDPAPAPVKP